VKHKLYLLVVFFTVLLLNSCSESIVVEPKLSNILNGTYQLYPSDVNEEVAAVLEVTPSSITSHSYDFSGTLTFNNVTYQISGKEVTDGLTTYLTPQIRQIGGNIEATLSLSKEKVFLLCGSIIYGTSAGEKYTKSFARLDIYDYTETTCQPNSKIVGTLNF